MECSKISISKNNDLIIKISNSRHLTVLEDTRFLINAKLAWHPTYLTHNNIQRTTTFNINFQIHHPFDMAIINFDKWKNMHQLTHQKPHLLKQTIVLCTCIRCFKNSKNEGSVWRLPHNPLDYNEHIISNERFKDINLTTNKNFDHQIIQQTAQNYPKHPKIHSQQTKTLITKTSVKHPKDIRFTINNNLSDL